MKQFTSQYPKDILMSISIRKQTNKSNNAQKCDTMIVMKREKTKRRYFNQGQCINKILFISLLLSHNQL